MRGGGDEPDGGDSFRSQGRCVGLRLASRRDNATRGLTTHGDAILISVIFSLASYTRRLTRRDANGENSGMLPEASNSSSDIDLHIYDVFRLHILLHESQEPNSRKVK